jgi:hypothetical protein
MFQNGKLDIGGAGNDIFWYLVFGIFQKKIFCFFPIKSTWLSYEVSFISALGMVSSKS